MFSLKGKVAFITGAARGLGFEIAKTYAQQGAQVILHSRHQKDAQAACDKIGAHAKAVSADLANPDDINKLMTELNRLDILVNNVGMRRRGALDTFSQSDLEEILQVNTIAAFELSRQAAKIMKPQKSGKIINITSIAAQISRGGDAAYVMSKGALESLTRALAAELGQDNIQVNAIAPGYFATETNQDMANNPEVANWLSKRTSLGRWGHPGEITGAAVFLASDESNYVTGHTLNVDGGYIAHF